MSLLLSSLMLATAHAVPMQTMHQGRLLDGDGVPMEGEAEVTFRLIDADTGGTIVWEETSTLALTNGFYISMLGADEDENPLDTDMLDQAPLWLELQLTGEPAMFPRSPVTSVPYARIAGVAEEVDGGVVNASEVQVDGAVVIDADGTWVGPPPEVDWSDLTGVPLGFSDESDADSLADIVCEDGQVMGWAGTSWTCSEDVDTWRSDEEIQAAVAALPLDFAGGSTVGGRTPWFTDDFLIVDWADLTGVPEGFADEIDDDIWLSESEVEGYITDGAIDLASGSTIGGDDIATGAHTTSLGWDSLTGVPSDFADETDDDTQLSESEVQGYITDAAIDLASGSTIGGDDIATGAHTTTLGWSDLSGIPSDFADEIDDDTWLSESEVQGYITDAAIDLASGSTIGGDDIATGVHTTTLGWSDLTGIPDGLVTDSDDAFFGDGSDGDVTVSSPTGIDRAMQYANLTIGSGGTLRSSSSSNAFLVIFVSGTLTIDGRIDMDARGASAGSGGTGNIGGYIGLGGEHDAVGGTSGTAGGDGNGSGQSGGDGKAGGSGGSALWHSGGAGGELVPGGASPNDIRKNIPRYAASALPGMYGGGGSGGGGGGGGGGPSRRYAPGGDGGDGGDAGKGGGGIIISAKNIVVNSGGVITANGIDGTDGTDGTDGSADSDGFAAGGGGGGAGGGGGESGTIILIYTSLDNSGTISSSGGTGGAGGEGGSRGDGASDGSDGSDGPTGDDGDSNSIISMDVSSGE